MKVLILTAGLEIGAAHGGAERFGLELASALQAHARVSLCAFWQRGSPLEQAWLEAGRAAGLDIFFAARWQGRWNLAQTWRGIKTVLAWCRQRKPDVVHSHFQAGTLAALIGKARGLCAAALRTAHIDREWGSGLNAWVLRSFWNGWVFPVFCSAESGVSADICRRLDARLAARLTARKAVLLPNALPVLEPAGVRSVRLDPHYDWIGGAGRLCSQKDPLTLLRAFALLADENPRLRLVWAGDGPLRDAWLAEARRLEIAGRVNWLGALPGLGVYLPQLKVFVLPSRYEGLPTVLLEAAARGIPAAASDIPGVRELAAQGFHLFVAPPGQPQALAEAIRAAYCANPFDPPSGLDAYRFDRLAARCMAWYQQCLNHRPV